MRVRVYVCMCVVRLSPSLAPGPSRLTIYPPNGWLPLSNVLLYFTVFCRCFVG